MRKYILIISFLFLLGFQSVALPMRSFAQPVPSVNPPQEGEWRQDPDVTFLGKTASRSGQLMDLALLSYKWSNDDGPLQVFWVKIRNIVYILLLIVILISAFTLIITGGQNLSIIMFARRFLLVVLLITFSYTIVKFLYVVVDIIQGFFIRNPDGQVISTKDLFNMSFNYTDFIGYRRFGQTYDESAFVSMLLVRLTAITYYLMVLLLWLRKIILWFFIIVSPIFPLLLFHAPIRNTAKIWIGEFFRWLLYAPLFTLFLSSLVVLWRSNISIFPFDFSSAHKLIVYPTAINILLGGPGQQLELANSVNYTDTFGEYVIALIMLWVVIFLPFVLLQIFLDYLSKFNFETGPWSTYVQNIANKIPGNQILFSKNVSNVKTPPPGSPPPSYPTGMAKPIKYDETGVAMPIIYDRQTGEQKLIPEKKTKTEPKDIGQQIREMNQKITNITTNISNVQSNVQNAPQFKSQTSSSQTQQLVSFPIPTMRDIARYDSSKTSSEMSKREEIASMHETLEKIANPQSITNANERQQFTTLKEKLVQQQQKGDNLATSILHAANNVSNAKTSNISQISQQQSQAVSNVQETLQKIANPQSISNVNERQQFTSMNQSLTQASQKGDNYATNILSIANQTTTQMQETLQKIAHPETIANTTERQQYTSLKEKLVQSQQKGDSIANTIMNAANTVSTTNIANISQISEQQKQQAITQVQQKYGDIVNTQSVTLDKIAHPESITNPAERQQFTSLKEKLVQQQQKGDTVANSILTTAQIATQVTPVQAALPAINQVQTVSLEDYEEVKKTWLDNYKKAEVPKSANTTDRSQWIQTDVSKLNKTINLLTSKDQQQIDQGMKEVSSLLPFLMIGGFSQTEVVSYLQAKRNAAQEVLTQMKETETEEESLLETKKRETQKAAHMQTTMEKPVTISTSTTIEQEESPLTQVFETKILNVRPSTIETMKRANFQVPTIRDIVQYETNQTPGMQVHEMLQKLANPQAISSERERKEYTIMKQQLGEAASKGDALASNILNIANTMTTTKAQTAALPMTLPVTNQVQTVSLEDYEEVKKTWLDNYKTTELPKIQSDLTRLDRTINLLTSKDQQKVDEGMKEVSSLLPFLLIGGFSQTEVVSYLQAKKHAAEEVLARRKESETEEESLLETKKKETQKTMHMQTTTPSPETTSVSPEEEENNPLSQVMDQYTQRIKTINQSPINVSSFSIPTMRDIVRYETARFTSQKDVQNETSQMNDMLLKLANPQTIPSDQEKQQYTVMKEQLNDAASKGEPMAKSIVNIIQILSTAQQPTQAMTQLASTPLPQQNTVQTVKLEDYEEVRRTWEDVYLKLDASQAVDPKQTKITWIQQDIEKIKNVIALLQSGDPQKIAEGMKQVGTILPFLLIGGFSLMEITTYLQAKLNAAEDVIRQLSEQGDEEDTKVEVKGKKSEEKKEKEAEVDEKAKK